MSKGAFTARDLLRDIGLRMRDQYEQTRRVLSYAEYLELVASRPREQLRSSPMYIRDCFDHFGATDMIGPTGQTRRFNLFDCPWADGRDRLVGQEDMQNQIYRSLQNFVNEGVANKLILLHGPNGSAKSTLVRCVGRALQHYSTIDEGALYRINWVFPAQKISKSGIGFSGGGDIDERFAESYAHLPEELVDARLIDELHDHPIFLVPQDERKALLDACFGDDPDFVVPDYIRYGKLTHKSRAIYEALLTSYAGDYAKVWRHVQVERFFVRSRYREGYVTVEPQLSVDAAERQITADRSFAALPSALQSVSLFEYGGELVGANRGLIEYSDLLKRPLEAYKYLLTTVERASVSLGTATLFLDMTFIGTSNEIHLAAFKEIAEWQSFKGRLDLVRVPYLLNYTQEQEIYQDKLREAAPQRHVAPHCAYVAALWAVLTRMRKPMADKYPPEVSELVAKLTPVEKAELYGTGRAPDSLSSAQAKELRARVGELWNESGSYPNYEGRTGASPRELQAVLFNAATSERYDYVSPEAVLDEIDKLTQQTSVYPFLRQEALPGGYHDHRSFIDVVRERWLDRLDDEVRAALGLVAEDEYERLFEKYISHIMHWTKGEKIHSTTTGTMTEPDTGMMAEVEGILGVADEADDFRRDLIAKIGAWSLDNTGKRPDYSDIFADHFKSMREAYYTSQRKVVKTGIEHLLHPLTGNECATPDEARPRAKETLAALIERFGYTEASARDSVTLLARSRYAE